MANKTDQILQKLKGKKMGVFIDEGNVFYSQRELKWRIHWEKFLHYLEKHATIEMSRYYMGMPTEKIAYEKNIIVKYRLEKEGFKVVDKPLKKIYLNKQKNDFKNKCNFDVEITRDVIRNLDRLDVVIVVSGDSDFIGLRDDVLEHNKHFIFACFEHNVAWEIRRSYHIFFENIRAEIEYMKENKNPGENPR